MERKQEAKPDGPGRWSIAPVGPDARTAEACHTLGSEVRSVHNESLCVQRGWCIVGDVGARGRRTWSFRLAAGGLAEALSSPGWIT